MGLKSRPSPATAFIAAAWVVMSLSAFIFVSRFGSNVPYWDEWNIVDVLTGNKAVDLGWLWSEHNGHRIPLPRLVLLGIYGATGSDFRAGMYFNVLVLSLLALVMIRAAATQRGYVSYTDAFFAVVLLSWGQFENLLWTWQVTQVVPVVLAGIVLVIIVRSGTHLTIGATILAGMLVALLPLCGVPGLVYVPALSVWLGTVAMCQWRSRQSYGKYVSLAASGFSALALVLVFIYFRHYKEVSLHTHFSIRQCAKTAIQFLAGGFGPAAQATWPYSGWVTIALFVLTPAILGAEASRNRLSQRSRAIALLLFLAAVACLALSFGLGRPGYGFAARYGLIAAPALCAVYYGWGFGTPSVLRTLLQAGLFISIVVISPVNFREGFRYGRDYHRHMEAFRADLVAGKSAPELVARHAATLCPCPFYGESVHGIALDRDFVPVPRSRFPLPPWEDCVSFHPWLVDLITSLHQAGIGVFRYLQERNYESREVPIAQVDVSPELMAEQILRRDGVDANRNIAVVMAKPIPVYGLTIRAKRTVPDVASLQVFWKASKELKFTPAHHYLHYWNTRGKPNEQVHTLWLFETVDEVVINLDNVVQPAQLLDVKLLLPVSSSRQTLRQK